ncbi:MaoC family dehydratase N-terminal domain-containing protein [Cytobacillus sp. IB215316]|uniref:FAS1-like dehydratase domain-containing protein n=1 Tax=Cytobacillus sp. IB215316 TaxID=3097354 RepID=UPI002A10786E|nr:MaoC family dehydratase N-terminal domain-containing protein [Cytobacillus sp. IB215316]MDX8360082.1 MaoC family dehydratase N-terminal domain-containing protein [Cytobacillus sp. IB215316]
MLKDISTKVGMKFEPYTFSVEQGKVKEFVLAIGDNNPIYYSTEEARKQGYVKIPVPPTFSTVIDMWGGADFDSLVNALDLDALKVLHGEQSYEYVGMIFVGDVVTAVSQVVHANTKRNMNFITIETTYSNTDKETVLIGKSVIIERH